MLLTMTKIMFEVVTLSFEGVVILIFHFPSGATSQGNLCDGVIGNGVVSSKGIFVGHFAISTSDSTVGSLIFSSV